MAEYDELGAHYGAEIRERGERPCVYVPSFLHYLGDVRGKRVLDLGCGDGFMTEILYQLGAQVVGLDKSKEQVERARASATVKGYNIPYIQADAAQVPELGEFDIVTPTFLYHYAQTEEELFAMCDSTYDVLKPGGRVVGFNANPHRPTANHAEKYGVSVNAPEGLYDGSRLVVTFLDKEQQPLFSFNNYHWWPETYALAFAHAGLVDEAWCQLIVDETASMDLGYEPGFWDEFVAHSSPCILTCRRP